ncbi:MAG: hypothetical protein JNK58_03405 [Phycisphaerae bacterium]|nr:hypothetical protein [Phycisphaerae bacterium]
MSAKPIVIVNGTTTLDAIVHPGTTTGDLRRQLGLPEEFVISKRDGLPFGDTEAVYAGIQPGDKLFATPPATVGVV